ncbi:MAG: hypothetical protein ABIO69_06060 [Sphingomicrobium sp.]
MIRKPSGEQQEDRLHAAVGSVIETGAQVRAAGRTARKAGSKVVLYYLFGMMGFGLLMSSTPIWFKAVLGGLGYGLFRLAKHLTARRISNSADPMPLDGADTLRRTGTLL